MDMLEKTKIFNPEKAKVFNRLSSDKNFENALIIIYLSYTPQAQFIDWYRAIYSPFDIVFYAKAEDAHAGEYPVGVHWIDLSIKDNYQTNFDWFAHKTILDAITRYREYARYIYMHDDLVFRYWKLSDAPKDKYWVSPVQEKYAIDSQKPRLSLGRQPRMREFYEFTSGASGGLSRIIADYRGLSRIIAKKLKHISAIRQRLCKCCRTTLCIFPPDSLQSGLSAAPL